MKWTDGTHILLINSYFLFSNRLEVNDHKGFGTFFCCILLSTLYLLTVPVT